MAGMLDHLDEVQIVFPIPGKAEVIIHDFNYKRMVGEVISLHKMQVQFADVPASYTLAGKRKGFGNEYRDSGKR